MTTYLGKGCSFGLPRVPFVTCRQFMYLVISLLVLRAGCGIWLYQFLIIAYLFTLTSKFDAFPLQLMTPLENTKQFPPMILCCHMSPGNVFGSYQRRWHNFLRLKEQHKLALYTQLVIFMTLSSFLHEWALNDSVDIFIKVWVRWFCFPDSWLVYE